MLHCYTLKQVWGGRNPSYPVTKQIPLHRYKNRKGLYIYIIFHNIITIGVKTSHRPITTWVYIVTSIVTKPLKSVTKHYFRNIANITFLRRTPKIFYLFCNNHLTLSSGCGIIVFQVGIFFRLGQFRFPLNSFTRSIGVKMTKQREELRKQHNTHDPHDMHAWADNKPWWLRPLQVVGFVAAGVGLTLCVYYSTLILFLL